MAIVQWVNLEKDDAYASDPDIGNKDRCGALEVKSTFKKPDIPLTYTDAVLELVAARCTELESGGRMIDAILTNTILPEISRELLTRLSQGNPLKSVDIDAKDDEFVYTFG